MLILSILSLRAGEPELGVFGSLEPELLEKKTGAGAAWEKNQEPEPEPREKKNSVAGAGAGKKFAGSPALVTKHRPKTVLYLNVGRKKKSGVYDTVCPSLWRPSAPVCICFVILKLC